MQDKKGNGDKINHSLLTATNAATGFGSKVNPNSVPIPTLSDPPKKKKKLNQKTQKLQWQEAARMQQKKGQAVDASPRVIAKTKKPAIAKFEQEAAS